MSSSQVTSDTVTNKISSISQPSGSEVTPLSQVLKPRTMSSGGSSKRYTPYHKTPKSRLLHVTQRGIPKTSKTPVGEKGSAESDATPLSGITRDIPKGRPPKDSITPGTVHPIKCDSNAIVNKTWRVYRASPLYDFSSTPAQLKKYSRFLSAHMEAESMKGFAVGVEADVAKNATISVFKGLQVNQCDPDSLHITVKGKPKPGKKELPIVLEALLVSVNIDRDAKTFVKDEFTYYPILLVKGAKSLTAYLCAFLETEFDCYIKDMEFSSVNLGWMIAMWSGFVPDRSKKPVQLVFKVPGICEGLSQISVTIDAQDCKDLWDCISDENAEEFHEEQVVAFIKSLESHFYQHFKINLAKLSLSQTATAVALAGTEGKIKIFSATHLKTVLQFLTQLSWERFMETVMKTH